MVVRDLGLTDYATTWDAMRIFTQERTPDTPDEIWITEHPPVFTLGQAGKHEHILFAGNIPVVQTDRGGQVTYHGPGQIVLYTLWDLARLKLGVRHMVRILENAVITLLAEHHVPSEGRVDAPGVYVAGSKIASVGLRIRKSRSYHGIAFNVAMDLEPFSRINPCGYAGLTVTDCRSQGIDASIEDLKEGVARQLSLARQDTLKDR